MEVWRHISAGRLSELFGASTLEEDKFIRTLGWRGAAERDLAALSAGPRAALDAYAEGVNAYIEAHRGGLGLAFVVTGMKAGIGGVGGYDLEPWTALDSLAWQKVQAWQLGGNFDSEVFRMLADEKLGDPKLTDALFPAYKDTMPVITPSSQAATGPTTPMDAAASFPATAATPATDAACGAASRRPASGSSRSPASTRAVGSSAITRSARTTGSSPRRRASPAARSSRTIRISESRCRRSGS